VGPAVACDLLLASQAPALFTARRHALAHGFDWQVVEHRVCCSWKSWWSGQLRREALLLFFRLHGPLAKFFWWFYSYGSQQGPDRQQKKRGGRAQAEEKARGSCSRRPRTRERKPRKRKGPK